MSSIASLGSSTTAQYAGVGHHRRPDPSKMASELFSKLDTKGQGYLEKSDLESALSSVGSSSSSGSSSATADQVFSALDSNGDGKVTQDEMSSSLQKLSEQLNEVLSQFRVGPPVAAMAESHPEPVLINQVNRKSQAGTNGKGSVGAMLAWRGIGPSSCSSPISKSTCGGGC